MASTVITLQREHALTGAVVIGAGLLSLYLGEIVGQARRKYNVPYPTMYVSETDKERQIFNCYQRSHQNYLEQIATFVSVLAMGSVYYPAAGAALGTVYLLGRIAYARGYQTGDPKKRGQGNFGYIGLIGLLGLSIHALLKIGQVL